MSDDWVPAKYEIASSNGVMLVAGYSYKGLGMHMRMKGSPKGRRRPIWSLTHLGTGHAICFLQGHVAEAFPIAFEIAELTDWDFSGLEGWKNRDRELGSKVSEILRRHYKHVAKKAPMPSNGDMAREIAMNRF